MFMSNTGNVYRLCVDNVIQIKCFHMHNIKNIRYLYHNCYIISTLKASLTKLWISFKEFKVNSGRTVEKKVIYFRCI